MAGAARLASAPTPAKGSNLPAIRHVVSLFDHRPWWNADVYGDRDPGAFASECFSTTDTKRAAPRGNFPRHHVRVDT